MIHVPFFIYLLMYVFVYSEVQWSNDGHCWCSVPPLMTFIVTCVTTSILIDETFLHYSVIYILLCLIVIPMTWYEYSLAIILMYLFDMMWWPDTLIHWCNYYSIIHIYWWPMILCDDIYSVLILFLLFLVKLYSIVLLFLDTYIRCHSDLISVFSMIHYDGRPDADTVHHLHCTYVFDAIPTVLVLLPVVDAMSTDIVVYMIFWFVGNKFTTLLLLLFYDHILDTWYTDDVWWYDIVLIHLWCHWPMWYLWKLWCVSQIITIYYYLHCIYSDETVVLFLMMWPSTMMIVLLLLFYDTLLMMHAMEVYTLCI